MHVATVYMTTGVPGDFNVHSADLIGVCESPQTSLVRLVLVGLAMALSLGTTETTETQKAISDIVTLQG